MKTPLCILLLFFGLTSCMPEENLPLRDVGKTPKYFIECYCKPGGYFTLSATTIRPISEDLNMDFSQELLVKIFAGKEIRLEHALYTVPGSDFIYNYGSQERLMRTDLDTLSLLIETPDQEKITASTSIPSPVTIYNQEINDNQATIRFYTSENPEDNYYIFSVESISQDTVIKKESRYIDHSDISSIRLVEKTVILTHLELTNKIIFNLKRITQANYEYQLSLSGANSANQSSITTPVSLKGNLNGSLGIFTCYTEDRAVIEIK